MTDTAAPLRPPGVGRYLAALTRYGIVWVTLALFVVLAATTEGFLTGPDLRNVLDQQATLLIAASVATLTMIAGGFDVSISAVAIAAPLVALRVENATGGNAEAARLAGVRTRQVVVVVFTLSGLAAGLAGVVAASRTISATPSDDFSFVFGVIAAIVVGGTSIAGGTGAVGGHFWAPSSSPSWSTASTSTRPTPSGSESSKAS